MWQFGKRNNSQVADACSGSEIEQITSQKLLGVTLESHLNCTEHIDELCKKVAQRVAVLKKDEGLA